jgi:hypothetical protein
LANLAPERQLDEAADGIDGLSQNDREWACSGLSDDGVAVGRSPLGIDHAVAVPGAQHDLRGVDRGPGGEAYLDRHDCPRRYGAFGG